MTKRLSATITAIKEYVYRHRPLRYLCYAAVGLALLFFWLYSGESEIAFVYNDF